MANFNDGMPQDLNGLLKQGISKEKLANDFAEGSGALKNLLLNLWGNGIGTFASCAGHTAPDETGRPINPYLVMFIDGNEEKFDMVKYGMESKFGHSVDMMYDVADNRPVLSAYLMEWGHNANFAQKRDDFYNTLNDLTKDIKQENELYNLANGLVKKEQSQYPFLQPNNVPAAQPFAANVQPATANPQPATANPQPATAQPKVSTVQPFATKFQPFAPYFQQYMPYFAAFQPNVPGFQPYACQPDLQLYSTMFGPMFYYQQSLLMPFCYNNYPYQYVSANTLGQDFSARWGLPTFGPTLQQSPYNEMGLEA